MKEWILSICALGLITTIILMILPQGKLSPVIKGVLSLFMFFVVIEPVISYDFSRFDLNSVFNVDSEVALQQNYLNYVNERKIKEIENDCISILNKLDIVNPTLKFDYEIIDNKLMIKSVIVNILNTELNWGKDHTNIIDEIQNNLSKYLKIDKGLIVVYG